MMKVKYVGQVRDRLSESIWETSEYETYREAHEAAERLDNKLLSDGRGDINVYSFFSCK